MQAILDLFANFGVTWDRFFGQLLVFAILVIVLKKFMYGPVMAMLDERKQRIAQGLKDAEDAATSKAESEQQAADRLKQATKQAEELLAQAKASAEQLKAEIQAQTQTELQRARDEQAADLARAKQQMLDEVRSDVVSLVVKTTTKVLQSELTKDQQQSVVKQATEAIK
jgi:F-type H+-transporting ATPase subunit b